MSKRKKREIIQPPKHFRTRRDAQRYLKRTFAAAYESFDEDDGSAEMELSELETAAMEEMRELGLDDTNPIEMDKYVANYVYFRKEGPKPLDDGPYDEAMEAQAALEAVEGA